RRRNSATYDLRWRTTHRADGATWPRLERTPSKGTRSHGRSRPVAQEARRWPQYFRPQRVRTMTQPQLKASDANQNLTPKLRFPEFRSEVGWDTKLGGELFDQISNREPPVGLPVLAITQEHGAIPRDEIDYHVSVTDKSVETYKEVRPGDFIISLRSF